MHPPDELMVDVFLPSIRQLVSRRLSSDGYSQRSISSLLGVTQASVSIYLATDPGRAYASLQSLSISGEESDRYATLLSEDLRRNPLDAQSTLDSIWKGILGRGSACPAHRALYPTLADCDICMADFSGASAGPDAVALVAEAVALLQRSPNFAMAMPEVSVNLAYAPEGAESTDQVVAVPGRIVKVRGRATSMMRPEFGSSGHLARVLLLVEKKRADLRACLNLRYDERMARALKRLRIRTLKVGGHPTGGKPDPTVAALASKLAEGKRFDAVVDVGGSGTEPNVYLFGRTPRSLAELALRLSDAYSSG